MFLVLIITVEVSQCQSVTKKVLPTKIEEVTVYINGAQIIRKGSISIPQGETLIKVKGLSPFVNPKSISVKATGMFVILSVNHKLNYLNELRKNKQVDSLILVIEKLEFKISTIQNSQEVLREKHSLLNANKDLSGDNGVSISELSEAVKFYENQILDIKKKSLENSLDMKQLKEEKQALENQINMISSRKEQPTSEIFIKVKSAKNTSGEFEISYPVKNAGWFPKYDIRVENVESPLLLEYKADVYQNTGVDWDNITLQLSTADPNQSGVLPNLKPWYLNYERNTVFRDRDYSNPNALYYDNNAYRVVSGVLTDDSGEPLPGVNVVIKGTTRGTTTDLEGRYQLTVSGDDILVISYVGFETQEVKVGNRSNIDAVLGGVTELQEVVVSGYGYGGARSFSKPKAETITTSTIQKTTSFVFKVDDPYSVKTTGEKLTVDIKNHQLEAKYQYYAIPKIDPDAFLISQLTDWGQFNLLEGEANLFFEGTFVGTTILDPKAFSDTLDISLGRDKSITIEREAIQEFTKMRSFGSNKAETRSFKIKIRNEKDYGINLTIFDQIPIPAINQITVSTEEISDGILEERTGIISWEMDLMSRQQTEKILTYEVKYPKYEKVVLE